MISRDDGGGQHTKPGGLAVDAAGVTNDEHHDQHDKQSKEGASSIPQPELGRERDSHHPGQKDGDRHRPASLPFAHPDRHQNEDDSGNASIYVCRISSPGDRARKERTILAYLISHAGWVVSADDFIEELWGERPPRTADKTLGSYVSRLRRALDADRTPGSATDVILTRGDGYALEIADHEIDAVRFEGLAEEGRRLLDERRPSDARPALDEALALWRGQAYQDYRYTGFGAAEGERLDELRRSASEDRIDSRLAGGDAAELVAELEAMAREEPLREHRWGQLMLALYRAGRQAEAVCQRAGPP